jgi:hypothetical protein
MGILLAGSFCYTVKAQAWQLAPDSAAQVFVTGTSSLTDWKVTSSDVTGVPEQLVFSDDEKQITSFGFKVPIEGMDGGRGSSMNDKILTAFKSAENPFVEYNQTEPANVTKSGNTYTITSTGTLSMAGTSKTITVVSTGVVKNGVLIITGFQGVKMSDFNMTPPSAMFGQIKTHDDVVVNYEFRYLKQ